MRSLSQIRTIFFFIFIGTITVGLFAYSFWGNLIPIEEIKDYVESKEGAPLVFLLLYFGLSIFFPTTPLMAIGGILFGFWKGLTYTIIAGLVSAIFTFLLARILGKAFVDDVLKHERGTKLLEKYDEKMAKHGILTTIVLRIMPIMPFNILNLIMGISRVSLKDYILGTVIGLIPSNVLAVYFGSLVLTERFRELSFYLAAALVTALVILAYFRIMIVWSYFGRKR